MAKKTKKILIIENDPQMVDIMCYPLQEEGYVVLFAKDAQEGLQKARREQPDLVMVDFKLGKVEGSNLSKTLRKDPATSHQRILMLAEESDLERLETGRGSSIDDFLIKPFSATDLVVKIHPLLISPDDEHGKLISTGNPDLDSKMGGGVPIGSLLLIEGDSGAGKSVLAQQMMHGCLVDGFRLSVFTSENTVKSLIKQMRSLNLDVLDYLLLDKLKVFPVETSQLGAEAPSILINSMIKERSREMVYVDSLTSFIPSASDKQVLSFFEESKRLCGDTTTVIVIVHSHGVTRELLTRIRSLCDAHFQLRTEKAGSKLVKTLEVTKVRGAEATTGNIVSFEVEPGWGIRVIPLNKVKG